MANKETYQIIDEPKLPFSTNLIVNPVWILLAAMILPFIWVPPFYGRYWLPFLWLIVNGILLGSATLKKEVIYAAAGLLLIFAIFYLSGVLIDGQTAFSFSLFHYLFLIISAVFFLFLYLIVFTQNVSYEIFSYYQEKNP